MIGVAGLRVTVDGTVGGTGGGTTGPVDILLVELSSWTWVAAAEGAGFPKSASNDEAASSSSLGLKEPNEISICSESSLSDSVEHWGYA